MSTREELGRRLRMARFERNLTLKQVAARCGMSATHISEVERGKTSPTIGALQRIAGALGENPAAFVRADRSEPLRVTRAHECSQFFARAADGSPMTVELLSKGIPGGYVQVLRKKGSPGQKVLSAPRIGEVVLLCLRGSMRFGRGDETWTLREGDAVHTRTDDGFSVEAIGDEETEGVWILAAPVLLPT
jgi:transcriptional regulator with XRE-family HTH domain